MRLRVLRPKKWPHNRMLGAILMAIGCVSLFWLAVPYSPFLAFTAALVFLLGLSIL